tara:strand:+ start:98 stop:517 length:420 start_codon:yes stop_codon:yes gene_type:complete
VEIERLMNSIKIGNATIDGEHRALFECLQEINAHLCDKKGEKTFAACKRLMKMLEAHFESEEEILHTAGFPRLDRHIGMHHEIRESLRQAFTACRQACRNNQPTKCLPDLTFILVDHFLRGDMDYKSHLQMVNMANENG